MCFKDVFDECRLNSYNVLTTQMPSALLVEYCDIGHMKGTKRALCADVKRCPEAGVLWGKLPTVEQNVWCGPT